MKVRVDDDRCRGHGMCCGVSPTVFEMSEDGYALAVLDEVPAELRDEVRTAAAQCPEGAIAIDE